MQMFGVGVLELLVILVIATFLLYGRIRERFRAQRCVIGVWRAAGKPAARNGGLIPKLAERQHTHRPQPGANQTILRALALYCPYDRRTRGCMIIDDLAELQGFLRSIR